MLPEEEEKAEGEEGWGWEGEDEGEWMKITFKCQVLETQRVHR